MDGKAGTANELDAPVVVVDRAGGWQLGLAGLISIAVAYGFARYGYGLFLPTFHAQFSLSLTMEGVIASGSYLSYTAAVLLGGLLARHRGPRLPVLIGGTTATLGSALIATAPNAGTLAVGAVLAGSSAGWTWTPYPEAVRRQIPAGRRNRLLAVVSTGTAFGLVLSAGAALAIADSWRLVWAGFSLVALAATLWNARLLPTGPDHVAVAGEEERSSPRLRTRRLVIPVYSCALLYGLASAVYWSFAPTLLSAASTSASVGPALWIVIGVAGMAGLWSGHLVGRWGLRVVAAVGFVVLGASLTVLAIIPVSWTTVIISAVGYGVSFMVIAALLAIWSSRVFSTRTATGFSGTLLFLGLGSVCGAALAGWLAEHTPLGLGRTFLAAGILSAFTALVPLTAGP